MKKLQLILSLVVAAYFASWIVAVATFAHSSKPWAFVAGDIWSVFKSFLPALGVLALLCCIYRDRNLASFQRTYWLIIFAMMFVGFVLVAYDSIAAYYLMNDAPRGIIPDLYFWTLACIFAVSYGAALLFLRLLLKISRGEATKPTQWIKKRQPTRRVDEDPW